MVNQLVEKATTDKLIGPDWAMNVEICEVLNRDPTQIKDIIKGLKKRLKSKTPKVKVLALTLLDTILKNCGNVVLMHIVEKNFHLVLVKIGSKKHPDASVTDKLDVVLDTWREVFEHPRAGHPKFYAPQQEIMRRAGVAFPMKAETSLMPMYTTSRMHPHSSYPSSNANPDDQKEKGESSEGSEFPTLSLIEIQNVGALIDILSDMLNALDPGDKEGLRQDVIVDLVEQSRSYMQRLVHLINTASDEVLIRQGLSLNDDLHHVLAKYEAMVSGTSEQVKKPEPQGPLVDIQDLIVATGEYCKLPDGRSGAVDQCPIQLKPHSDHPSDDPKGSLIDLLSGEDYNSPKADDTLALVPVNEQQASSSESQQTTLARPDMLTQDKSTTDSLSSESNNPSGQTYSLTPQYQNQQQMFYSNGSADPAWNIQVIQGLNNEQHQPHYGGGDQSSGALPPPPWETESPDDGQLVGPHQPQPLQVSQMVVTHSHQTHGSTYPQSMGHDSMVGMYIQPITNSQLANLHNQQSQSNQLVGIPHSTQGGQMMVMLPHGVHGSQMASMSTQTMQNNQLESYGYGYDQNQGVQYLNQGMHGLSMQDDNTTKNYSYLSMNKPSSSGDTKLFGDLVNMAKLKPKNPANSTGGSL